MMTRKIIRDVRIGPKGHKHFHLVIRASAPSQEAEKFAEQIKQVINAIRRKHFPDTTIHEYKLGHLM